MAACSTVLLPSFETRASFASAQERAPQDEVRNFSRSQLKIEKRSRMTLWLTLAVNSIAFGACCSYCLPGFP